MALETPYRSRPEPMKSISIIWAGRIPCVLWPFGSHVVAAQLSPKVRGVYPSAS